MPGAEQHRLLTGAAAGSLPPWQKKILGPRGPSLLARGCVLPDDYFDLENRGYEKALPYMFFVSGRPFHYLPDSPIEAEYKSWRVAADKKKAGLRLERVSGEKNLNWEDASKGFLFYISRAVECLGKGEMEDFAGFAGVLLHSLQDAGVGLHALEGVDGVDIFALDRLIAPPADRPLFYPSAVLTSLADREVSCRRPSLLGESVGETAFILYTAYSKMVASARLKLVPLILGTYGGKTREAGLIYARMLSDCAGLCADVFYTIFCIASRRFLKKEIDSLKKIYLSEIKPVREPRGLSSPYRFLTMLRDASLDNNRQKVPLQLRVRENGRARKRVFRKGMGTGCHYDYAFSYELPAGVYRKFRCYTGLHDTLGRGGEVSVTVKFRERKIFRAKFSDENPSARVECPVLAGGKLELAVISDRGMGGEKNQLVWGEPVLLK